MLIRVVSFFYELDVRLSDFVAWFQEFFGMWDIIDHVLSILQIDDDLAISING